MSSNIPNDEDAMIKFRPTDCTKNPRLVCEKQTQSHNPPNSNEKMAPRHFNACTAEHLNMPSGRQTAT